MNFKFVLLHSAVLTPILLFFLSIYMFTGGNSDYTFYMSDSAQFNYPPVIPFVVNTLTLFVPKFTVLFLVNFFINVVFPYILFLQITKQFLPAFVFLYGSGIPFILFLSWFIPQGVIQVLMLFTFKYPLVGTFIFALFGNLIHREWLSGLLLSLFCVVLTSHSTLKKYFMTL